MKRRILTLALAALLCLSLAACGGSDYKKAAKQIEEITGEKTSEKDVKEAVKQLQSLSDEKVTAEDLVEFTREMYAMMDGSYEEPDDKWPFKDMPEWPVAEGLSWNNYSEENYYNFFVQGTEEDLKDWLADLEKDGYKGYFSEDGTYGEYYGKGYSIYMDELDWAESEHYISIDFDPETEYGFPEGLKKAMPKYNGDGVLMQNYYDNYDGMDVYYFNVPGETNDGAARFIDALLKDGWTNDYPDSNYGSGGGHYTKVDGKKTYRYDGEEYWYEWNEEAGKGIGYFGIAVETNS